MEKMTLYNIFVRCVDLMWVGVNLEHLHPPPDVSIEATYVVNVSIHAVNVKKNIVFFI